MKTKSVEPLQGYRKVAIDQFGQVYYFDTIKELRERIPGKCRKTYRDTENGTVEVGRVIGKIWLTFYAAVRP